ncbi:MAG: LemA family protein [Candidatus Falkowbacteria bacterium]|nr:MAG: LemA family protein [Candidatus Falkowbacteria bacterium]
MTILYVILGIVVVVALFVIAMYNGLIRLKNRVDEAWSDIDVQLKRRYDLIPNLIETVKGYAAHEQATFEKVINARNQAMSAQQGGDAEAQAKAENALSGTLKSIFALAESYPDLKANQNFLELQRELTDTEDKIQASRRFYNTNVRDFNTKIQVFPNNMIAGWLKFSARKFFEIEDAAERKNVEVKF